MAAPKSHPPREPAKVRPAPGAPSPSGPGANDLHGIVRDLNRWFLVLGAGLGGLSVLAAYLGLLPLASMLGSIVLVSITLYFFLKFWPEDDRARPAPQPAASDGAPSDPEGPHRRQAMVSAVRIKGPPRLRFMVALREVVRRQDTYRISPQGAERFARTIRYILRNSSKR